MKAVNKKWVLKKVIELIKRCYLARVFSQPKWFLIFISCSKFEMPLNLLK